MPTCISYVVSTMEAVGVLLCVTHTAEHLRLHTEPCGSLVRANAERNNNWEENALVSQQCSQTEEQGTHMFTATDNH